MQTGDDYDDVVNRFPNVTVHNSMGDQRVEYARQEEARAEAARQEEARARAEAEAAREAARAAARAKAEAVKYTKNLIQKYGLIADAGRVFDIHGPDIKNIKIFLKGQRDAKNVISSASTNSFLSKINKHFYTKPSTKPSIVPTKHSSAFTASTNHLDGGNKSRRNTRTYRHSKKHKRVRHTRRKRTRRNHRSRRHR